MKDNKTDKNLKAFFQSKDKNYKKILPSFLPGHETVYAMTIHKSQGSEFNKVLLILPDSLSPVITRELLYTGITRAKTKIIIWASQKILEHGISSFISRSSGIRDALWFE